MTAVDRRRHSLEGPNQSGLNFLMSLSLSLRLDQQRKWRRFPGQHPCTSSALPSDPVPVTTQTDHQPVQDGAAAATDQQTHHLHGRQAALVQRNRDDLQRGLCYRWVTPSLYWWGHIGLFRVRSHIREAHKHKRAQQPPVFYCIEQKKMSPN